jgi:bifunctional non-homologous end joining protein LigD
MDATPEVAWSAVVAGALELKDRLAELGLEAFCKTTGGKGLHVVLPIERRHDWPTAKAFTRSLAEAMAADSPDRYTVTLAKAACTGRIFLDHLRNDEDATAVAPYSPRVRPGAPVAMPVAWDEVTPKLDPAAFTVATALQRARGRSDPWAGLARCRQRLPTARLQSLTLAREQDGWESWRST